MNERQWLAEYDMWARAIIVNQAAALVDDDLDGALFFAQWAGAIGCNLFSSAG